MEWNAHFPIYKTAITVFLNINLLKNLNLANRDHFPVGSIWRQSLKKMVYCRFAYDSNKIYEFRFLFYMLWNAHFPVYKIVKIVFLCIDLLKI